MVATDRTLEKRWPDHLVERVASRGFVLVVGAGISRNCVNKAGASPLGWGELLDDLTRAFATGSAKKQLLALLEQRRYLDAAEFLKVRARGQAKEEDFLNRIAHSTDGGKSREEQFQPSPIHEVLLSLEPDVIVTTNYDRVLERATQNGYNVHPYESPTLGRDVRSGMPVLVKIHGSVDNASKIILTRSDYTRLRRAGDHVLEVLQALFLTRTAFFVGYSFSDPDIQLLLENVLGARGDVPGHYLLTSSAIPAYQQEVYNYSYGTAVVKYRQGDYVEMNRMLELLSKRVQFAR